MVLGKRWRRKQGSPGLTWREDPTGESVRIADFSRLDGADDRSEEQIARASFPTLWPEQNDAEAVNEYDCVGLYAKAYPTLFPFGTADLSDKERAVAVDIKDWLHFVFNFSRIRAGTAFFESPFCTQESRADVPVPRVT